MNFDIHQVKHDYDNSTLICRPTIGKVIDLALQARPAQDWCPECHASAAPTKRERELDASLDRTMADRDQYHEWADKLAEAIAAHFDADIGEHSSANCPWAEALDVIGNAPSAAPEKQMLSNLLARIHRDGGHREAAIGTEAAVEEADLIVANINAAQVALPTLINAADRLQTAARNFNASKFVLGSTKHLAAAREYQAAENNLIRLAIATDATPPAQAEPVSPVGVVTETGLTEKWISENLHSYFSHSGKRDNIMWASLEDIAHFAHAAAAQATPPAVTATVPEGWPEEPTPEMQHAGASAIRFDTSIVNKLWTANAVYRAMRAVRPAAAPSPLGEAP